VDTDEERKRKRRLSSEATRDRPKLRRVESGEAGKIHACNAEGCEKKFKTVSPPCSYLHLILITFRNML
jgi:hypothetical protein